MFGFPQIGGFEVAGADCRDEGRAADLREGLAQTGELFLVFEAARLQNLLHGFLNKIQLRCLIVHL